jgi:SSS family solute:Na+ symporter
MGGCFFAAYMAKKIRQMGVATLAEVIDNKIDSKRSRVVASVISAIRDFMYLGSQIVAFGTVFNFLFGIPMLWGSIIGTVILLIFCTAGGLTAVMWTDYIQLIIIMIGTAIIVPVAANRIGSWENFILSMPKEALSVGSVTISQIIGWFLMGIFAYTVAQSMYQRALSARNSKVSQHGLMLGNSLGMLWYMLPFFIGMLARSLYGPDLKTPFLTLAADLGGPILGSILMATLISAVISTASTSVNLIASNITIDIYHRFFNVNASKVKLLKVSRIATVASGVIGLIVALSFPQILEMIFLGNKVVACIAPSMLLIIFWKKAKDFEAPIFWSMLLGAISLLGFYFYSVATVIESSTFVWKLDPIYVGLGVSAIVLLVGRIFNKIPDDRQLKKAS